MNRIVKKLLIIFGTISLGLGIIGIFVPLLPTTPFLLLTAALYAKSSPRFYHRLTANKWMGPYIENYRAGRGVSIRVKVYALTLLWTTILTTIYVSSLERWLNLILLLIAGGVSIHLIKIKSRK